MENFQVSGNIVDLLNEQIFSGTIYIENGKIVKIEKDRKTYKNYILPGFIDAHIHIESSMLPPSEFARLASIHGTVATVSDPHEIANVLGVDGVIFMLENASKIPFKFYFGVPSCVPATNFETSGGKIGVNEIKFLFENYNLKYLSEMMNYPGVINSFPDVLEKIALAKKFNRPIDGHAPGLKGDEVKKYIQTGITTDHECYSYEEALHKAKLGMKILIREGSAAKNFEALAPLISEMPEMCMFCTDDAHPDHLIEKHIKDIVLRAFDLGYDVMNVLKIASLNPIQHYKLDVGLLQVGDPADFIVIDNFQYFNILKTYVNGNLIAENGKSTLTFVKSKTINNFNAVPKIPNDFKYLSKEKEIKVIKSYDGELITDVILHKPEIKDNDIQTNLNKDILKISVVNRYINSAPAIALINGIGLKKGAIATSVAHDSHNIIAVGIDNDSLAKVVNAIIESKGGMAVYDGKDIFKLELPIAGLMSNLPASEVANQYKILDTKAKELGSTLSAPFMTLSFMALLVIPKIKLSDKGLFNSETFQFIYQ
jgi:adenine deaminase